MTKKQLLEVLKEIHDLVSQNLTFDDDCLENVIYGITSKIFGDDIFGDDDEVSR